MAKYNKRPLVIFDQHCNYCRKWADRIQKQLAQKVYFLGYQDLPDPFLSIQKSDFKKALYFVDETNQCFNRAEAIYKLLSYTRTLSRFSLQLYYYLPGFKWLSELAYHIVAKYRHRL